MNLRSAILVLIKGKTYVDGLDSIKDYWHALSQEKNLYSKTFRKKMSLFRIVFFRDRLTSIGSERKYDLRFAVGYCRNAQLRVETAIRRKIEVFL